MLASPAFATPWSDCRTNAGSGAILGKVEAKQGSSLGSHQGIKGDLWIASANNDCARISSFTVVNASGFTEVGWVLGWDACGTNDYQSGPEGFAAYQFKTGSGYHCTPIAGWASSQFTLLMLKDENSDTQWGYYRSGTILGTMDVDFDRGTGFTLGERHNASDSAFSHFKNLKYQVVGNGAFNDFNDLDPGPDTDNTYNCIMLSQTEQKVQDAATTCTD